MSTTPRPNFLDLTYGLAGDEMTEFLEVQLAMSEQEVRFDDDPEKLKRAHAATEAASIILKSEQSTDYNVIRVDFGNRTS